MQFHVPQFIETEDKIVGPFTLKQFGYLGVAGGLVFVFFFTLNTSVFWVFSIPVVALGISLAFIKINGQPLDSVILAGTRYFWKPQRYVWQPEKHETPGASKKAGVSLEKIVAGLALKTAWRYTQTGSISKEEEKRSSMKTEKQRYQVFQSITGERRAAKRVDYS